MCIILFYLLPAQVSKWVARFTGPLWHFTCPRLAGTPYCWAPYCISLIPSEGAYIVPLYLMDITQGSHQSESWRSHFQPAIKSVACSTTLQGLCFGEEGQIPKLSPDMVLFIWFKTSLCPSVSCNMNVHSKWECTARETHCLHVSVHFPALCSTFSHCPSFPCVGRPG